MVADNQNHYGTSGKYGEKAIVVFKDREINELVMQTMDIIGGSGGKNKEDARAPQKEVMETFLDQY